MRALFVPALFSLGAALLASCGLPLGTNVPNDAAPTGTIVSQGSFTGLNGKTVTGTATIYNTGSAFVIRLAGMSIPEEANLQIIPVFTSTGEQTPIAVTSFTGTRNYSMTATVGAIWSQIIIRSPSTRLDYGQALLTSPFSGT